MLQGDDPGESVAAVVRAAWITQGVSPSVAAVLGDLADAGRRHAEEQAEIDQREAELAEFVGVLKSVGWAVAKAAWPFLLAAAGL